MKKLHNKRYPSGLEWVVLKKIPYLFAASVFIPGFMLIISRYFPFDGPAYEVVRMQVSIDFLAIATFFTSMSLLLVVGILCITICLMKGPAYVADAYPLNDADEPDPNE